jgi:death-on-curing protein
VTNFLASVEVRAMHADLVHRYGGSAGLRDAGLLQAALQRLHTGYYADLVEQAAALWESLAQNHAFVDGNKRIAFAATFTFLNINGVTMTSTADAAFAFIDGLYARNSFRFDSLVPWVRANVTTGQTT